MKHSISTVTAALCLLSALVSCGSETISEQAMTAPLPTDSFPAEATVDLEPVSAVEAVDYDGYVFRWLVQEPGGINFRLEDIRCDEPNGEIINDAVYQRNLAISEKYNITFSVLPSSDVYGAAYTAIAAADDAYDIVMPTLADGMKLGINGNALDIADIPHIRIAEAWWNKDAHDTLSVGGRHVLALSDINLLSFEGMAVMMFSKAIVEETDLESPYTRVKDGTWTYDSMIADAKSVYRDLNGNSAPDKDDRYGFTGNTYVSDALIYAGNFRFMQKDEQDFPVWSTVEDDFFGYFTKVIETMNDERIMLYADRPQYTSERQTIPLDAFIENRALYYIETMAFVAQLRNMEFDFGLLPLPKYDAAQECYTTFTHHGCSSCITVPVTNGDTDRTGRILEDMAFYSSLYVRPAYYDTTLEGKLIRDDASYEMLDYIFGHPVFDPALYLSGWGLNAAGDLRSLVQSNKTDVVSYLVKREKVYLKMIENVKDLIIAIEEQE